MFSLRENSMKSHRDEVLRVVSSLRFKSKVRKLAGMGPLEVGIITIDFASGQGWKV